MKNQLLDLLRQKGPVGPSAIASTLQISPQMVHRHLKNLLKSGEVRKQGMSPKVLYFAIEKHSSYPFPVLATSEKEYIDQHYFTVKPDGEVMIGLEGFQWWALKTLQHKHFKALASEYITTHKKYNDQYRNQIGVIDATFKVKDTFDECYLDYLFYQEFYSLPKFGKTKTGQMVFLGKSGQNVKFIQALANMSRQSILNIIEYYRIDGVIF
nr:winged helix-turn-helix domain-containing protein [Pseudomonadota bacterium]